MLSSGILAGLARCSGMRFQPLNDDAQHLPLRILLGQANLEVFQFRPENIDHEMNAADHPAAKPLPEKPDEM